MSKSIETKIPALTKADEKKLSDIKGQIDIHIEGLKEAVEALCKLTRRSPKSADLKEFYKWVYHRKLFYLDSHLDAGHSDVEELEDFLNEIFKDFEVRQDYQKVYHDALNGLNYDYVPKKDLEPAGFERCPHCNAWTYSWVDKCPACSYEKPDTNAEVDNLSPYTTESGLIIDPLLMSKEDRDRLALNNDNKDKVKVRVLVRGETGFYNFEDMFLPLEEAKEIARPCPKCGLWVDDDEGFCDCGYIFKAEDTPKERQNETSFCIGVVDGLTPETLADALGGFCSFYSNMYGNHMIYFDKGTLGIMLDCEEKVPLIYLKKKIDHYEWIHYLKNLERLAASHMEVLQEAIYVLCEGLLKCTDKDYTEVFIYSIPFYYADIKEAYKKAETLLFEDAINEEIFSHLVEWMIDRFGLIGAFEFCAQVYKFSPQVVGGWVQRLGEELAAVMDKDLDDEDNLEFTKGF